MVVAAIPNHPLSDTTRIGTNTCRYAGDRVQAFFLNIKTAEGVFVYVGLKTSDPKYTLADVRKVVEGLQPQDTQCHYEGTAFPEPTLCKDPGPMPWMGFAFAKDVGPTDFAEFYSTLLIEFQRFWGD